MRSFDRRRACEVASLLGTLLAALAALAEEVYEQRPPSRDGTGKLYMGREIAHVMSHRGAGWLERPEREREERVELLISRLPLEPDDVVADIGAGSGYHTFRIARRLTEGRVLAVDIQPEMLAIIEGKRQAEGVSNVETIRGTPQDPRLPEAGVDLVLLVDAYHEFSHPREMGRALAASLAPGGRIVLVEFRAEDPDVPIKRLHKMSEAQVKKEMQAIGLEWQETQTHLPRQHVLVFARKTKHSHPETE